MSVADNGDLTFTQIVMNETLEIYDIFKDKYGYKYVKNDYLDAYDEDNKTLYYTKYEYMLTREGVVIYFQENYIDYSAGGSYYVGALEKINADFSRSSISNDEVYHLNLTIRCFDWNYKAIIIENGYLYAYMTQENAYSYFLRINTETLERDDTRFGSYGRGGGDWDYDCIKSAVIDYNTVLLWSDRSGTPKLYCGEVWGDNAVVVDYGYGGIDLEMIIEDTATILLENCQSEGWTFDLSKLKFRYTTFTETIYYIVVLDENGTPTIVNSETYVAPEQDIVTFQPINAK